MDRTQIHEVVVWGALVYFSCSVLPPFQLCKQCDDHSFAVEGMKPAAGLEVGGSPGPMVGGPFPSDKQHLLMHDLKVTREKELRAETRKRITPEEKVGRSPNNAIICSSLAFIIVQKMHTNVMYVHACIMPFLVLRLCCC